MDCVLSTTIIETQYVVVMISSSFSWFVGITSVGRYCDELRKRLFFL